MQAAADADSCGDVATSVVFGALAQQPVPLNCTALRCFALLASGS
jgi:hypothetical protein